MALVAVLLTVGALWFTNRAVTPKQATWDDVLAEGENGGYKIITTEELSERYQKDANSLLLVDTRQEWEYRTGHLTGRGELSHGTHRVVKMAQGIGA